MLVKADYVAGVTIFGGMGETCKSGSQRILTPLKPRNMFCLNGLFCPFHAAFSHCFPKPALPETGSLAGVCASGRRTTYAGGI